MSGDLPRHARCVKCSALHLGQWRKLSADWLADEADSTSRVSSPRSMFVRDATEIIEIDRTRRCAAHLGTRQVKPHSAQVRSYA